MEIKNFFIIYCGMNNLFLLHSNDEHSLSEDLYDMLHMDNVEVLETNVVPEP